MKNSLRIGFAIGLILQIAVCVGAHTVGISRGEYRIVGSRIDVTAVFARAELSGAIPEFDWKHAQSNNAAIESIFVRGVEVHAAESSCLGKLDEVSLTEEDGVAIRSSFTCPAPVKSVIFNLNFLAALSSGHRHLANIVTGAGSRNIVAYAGNSQFEGSAAVRPVSSILPMFRLGIEHILTGYDHLVFLFGLILVGGRVRSILLVITAFTVAHSITLGMAALQIVSPNARLVEPAIALSIAYVGIENWFVQNASRRWMITFPFGLIHGFGFAGALREIALPHAQIPLALLSFNFGVEMGQLSVLAVVLPLVLWLRRGKWFAGAGVKALSSGVALAGLCWFLLRI